TSLYEIRRLESSYLFGDLALARRMSAAAAGRLAFARTSVQLVEHNFYTSLTLAALCDSASAEERPALLEEIAANQRQLGIWAAHCPENYRHKHLLVAAELARAEGRTLEAASLYEQAIEA